MLFRSKSKNTSQRIRRNKKLVYFVVIIGVGALLLSSALAYFGSFAPRTQTPTGAGELAELQYRISQNEQSLENTPDNLYLLTQLGNSYYQLGVYYSSTNDELKSSESFGKALDPYGKALEIEPDDVNVRVDRAVCAFWSGNYDIAEAEFETAITTDPTHAKAFFNYGIFLYLGLNQSTEALEKWAAVIELNPLDDPQLVANARSWINSVEEELNNPPQFDTTPQPQN